MAVLLDTKVIPRVERAAAFHAALNSVTSPARVSLAPDTEGMIRAWSPDEDVSFIDTRYATKSLRMSRTEPHLRNSGLERLSVAYNVAGSCVTTNRGRQELRNDRLRLTDTTSSYSIVWRGNCRVIACEVDYQRLGLSVDSVRAVMPMVSSSPLHDLLRQHLLHVSRVADSLPSDALAFAGAATASLIRAALLSVSPDDSHRRDAAANTLLVRIEDYIRRRLDDPQLTPARSAATHSISLRHLYVLFADRAETPSDWIVRVRLEAARADLATETANISATAHRWCFKDASHFSRRFKTAYGMTPREWSRERRRT